MFSKKILLFFLGFYEVEIEGMYIQRFINLAASKKIKIISSVLSKGTVLKFRCFAKDIEIVKEIAKKTDCLIDIKKEKGLPSFINRYKKRVYFIWIFLIAFVLLFINSLFIWNIDINEVENKTIEDREINKIYEILENNGVKIGKIKNNFYDKKESIINKIRLDVEEISWIGMEIKGTNLIVDIKKCISKEDEIEKENKVNQNDVFKDNNIYSNKNGKISKITVYSGTARKVVGDEVKEGEMLVEGIMEGKYTGIREVMPSAEILIEKEIKYEKEMNQKIELKEKTGNVVNKVEIYINNFKINLSKTLLNFENYDTIRENKRVKLFSNFYLPINFSFVKFEEWKKVEKIYNINELKDILYSEIEEQFKSEYDISDFEKIDIEEQTNEEEGKLKLTITYKVQEKIGTKRD